MAVAWLGMVCVAMLRDAIRRGRDVGFVRARESRKAPREARKVDIVYGRNCCEAAAEEFELHEVFEFVDPRRR